MTLIYAGIDEAGYGPMLGPLCVALCVLAIHDWTPDSGAPDLWDRLRPEVCRTAREARAGAVPVADSKKLKGPNSSTTAHPLRHLERGVLAFAHAANLPCHDDASLFDALGSRPGDEPWFNAAPTALPLTGTHAERAVEHNLVRRRLERAGVAVLALRCRMVPVAEFNDLVARTGSKASTTELALAEHLSFVRQRWGGGPDPVRVLVDRQSGRLDYRDAVARAWGADAHELERSPRLSRYAVAEHARVQFEPEAESRHFPVALASMVAKLARELAMARFNRYWTARVAELKPTAGYVQDARRWLRDARHAISPAERDALVRIA